MAKKKKGESEPGYRWNEVIIKKRTSIEAARGL